MIALSKFGFRRAETNIVPLLETPCGVAQGEKRNTKRINGGALSGP